MDEKIKEMVDAQNRAHAELKSYMERADAELKRFGVELPETKAALDRINGRLDELEAKFNRPAAPVATPDSERKSALLAFRKALLGREALSAEERKYVSAVAFGPDGEVKTLSTDNLASAGALLAPGAFQEGIIKDLTEVSPVRALARVIRMSTKSVPIAVRTAAAVASWSAERSTRTEDTTLAYSQKDLVAHEMTCLYKATNEQLEDSAFPIEAEMAAEFAEAFAAAEGTAFISGNAVGKPEGLITNSSVGSLNSGSATVFDADDLIDLVAQLKDVYYPGAAFMLNRKTLAFVRKLKAGDGHYLWAPAFDAANPPTLEGFPYRFATDLAAPSAGVFTTNSYPVLFGNFASAYRIGDRVGLTVQRLAEKYAETGEVGFLGRMRVAGLVANAAAVVKLKIST